MKDHLSGTVLDIGSGIGDITSFYSQCNVKKIIHSDYSDEMIPVLKKRFSNTAKHEVVQLDISSDDFKNSIAPGSINTITCSNVLEHIKDHIQALKNMHTLLDTGGKLVLLVPSLPQIYGTLDSLVGHYRRYTKPSAREALEQAGFKIESQHYMNIFGTITWYIAGRVLKQQSFNKETCSRLDKIVPILEGMESIIKPPFGQSLITVCQKS